MIKQSILTLTFICLSLGAHATTLEAARCAQDVVDYKHGGDSGIKFAAQLLTRLLDSPASAQDLESECREFLDSNPKSKDKRSRQLQYLRTLKDETPSNAYFFLRSAIRPLIVCEKDPSPFHRTCHSTTGKNWYETGFHPRAKDHEFLYRLGHSETPGGILVLGPQDEFTEEDREFIGTLPTSFTGDALIDLEAELTTKSYRMKIFMLERTTRFIEHYFQ